MLINLFKQWNYKVEKINCSTKIESFHNFFFQLIKVWVWKSFLSIKFFIYILDVVYTCFLKLILKAYCSMLFKEDKNKFFKCYFWNILLAQYIVMCFLIEIVYIVVLTVSMQQIRTSWQLKLVAETRHTFKLKIILNLKN